MNGTLPSPLATPNSPHSTRKVPTMFLPDTPIAMADGTERPIRDVRPKDVVLSSSGTDISVVSANSLAYDSDIIEVIYQDSGLVRATPAHPFLTDRGAVSASSLVPGDRLHTPQYSEGGLVLWEVEATHRVPYDGMAYYLVLSCDDSYVAGGVAVKHGMFS